MFRVLSNSVQLAHGYLKRCLPPGGVAVDATVGNGQDTLYLAGLVGPKGRVYGFDIQQQAVDTTSAKLAENGFDGFVTLFNTGHENISRFVTEPVDAVVFNLGYLPGGDHNLVTKPETTVRAVEQSLCLLKPGGLICIVVYTGHSGGRSEQNLLEEFLKDLGKKEYCVGKLDFINRENAPYILLVEKAFTSGRTEL